MQLQKEVKSNPKQPSCKKRMLKETPPPKNSERCDIPKWWPTNGSSLMTKI